MKKLIGATAISLQLLTPTAFAADQSEQENHFRELYGIEVQNESVSSYYADAEGLKGRQLFDALHEITGRNYRSFSYGEARDILYNKADNQNGKVYAHYSDLWVTGRGRDWKEQGDANRDGTGNDFINCEHIWPQSKFGKSLPMVSDIHHLFSTFSKPNGMRSHYAFGEVNRSLYSTSAGSKLGEGEIFEPADTAKGNVARAMLYFYTRYHNRNIWAQNTSKDEFFFDNLETFMRWHAADPVDEKEKHRNEVIYQNQRNRNPFIDRPEFVTQIGIDGFAR
ncbi:MAG: endonuclease [Candidatus Cloacimonetes bacterium]|nr:endonuclease [Candidatus Cloacimonadota bacterium]